MKLIQIKIGLLVAALFLYALFLYLAQQPQLSGLIIGATYLASLAFAIGFAYVVIKK